MTARGSSRAGVNRPAYRGRSSCLTGCNSPGAIGRRHPALPGWSHPFYRTGLSRSTGTVTPALSGGLSGPVWALSQCARAGPGRMYRGHAGPARLVIILGNPIKGKERPPRPGCLRSCRLRSAPATGGGHGGSHRSHRTAPAAGHPAPAHNARRAVAVTAPLDTVQPSATPAAGAAGHPQPPEQRSYLGRVRAIGGVVRSALACRVCGGAETQSLTRTRGSAKCA